MLAFAVGMNAALKNSWLKVYGDDYLFTSNGLLRRDHPDVATVLSILFPGYEKQIEQLKPRLFEKSQFALPVLLLEDGRQVRVTVPRDLPFLLASRLAPDVVVFGSSRGREGVRPDVISKHLGGKRVLNMSLSGAGQETIEIVFDALFKRIDGKVSAIVFLVEGYSFSFSAHQTADLWKAQVKNLDTTDTIQSRMSRLQRSLYARMPRIQNKISNKPISNFVECVDEQKMAQALKDATTPDPRLKNGVSPIQVEAFKRLITKARARATKVMFVDMPVSSAQRFRETGFPYRDVVDPLIGKDLISHNLSFWGLNDHAFFGAEGEEPCHLNPDHINPKAAFAFSERLSDFLKD